MPHLSEDSLFEINFDVFVSFVSSIRNHEWLPSLRNETNCQQYISTDTLKQSTH